MWERYVVDPEPSPIPLDSIRNCREICSEACIVTKDSYAERSGLKIIFQAARVASVIDSEIVVIDMYSGVNGYYRALINVSEYYGVDAVIGIDVGGDVLAYGFEENPWSPLADLMGLAVLNKFKQSYLLVHSLGSDRELLSKIVEKTSSEASSLSLLALNGFYGCLDIKLGSRRVHVSPLSLVSFILKLSIVYSKSLLARLVDNTDSLCEANDRLNSLGIYTEYDLERDLGEKSVLPENFNRDVLIETRLKGEERFIDKK